MASRNPVQFRAQPIDGINLDFCTASYWDPIDPIAVITRNIKVQVGRVMVRDFVSNNAPEFLGEISLELLKDEVSDETRGFLGCIHPSWMGGGHLPGDPRGNRRALTTRMRLR